MFLDIATILVSAGHGGPGCVSTRREKFLPRGGPDGGNGGDGGSVWVVATAECTTLLDTRYRRHYQADDGQPGRGQCRSGASGSDLEVPVPCGTTVYDLDSGMVLGDLVQAGERICVAKGGRGGKGNYEFRTARRQTPMYAQPGRSGERREIRLELKLIADIGLLGAPNAGKSTLLSVLTAARPKVAAYPFTTLVPNLGIVDLGDFTSCTLADIPGLIAGASEGKGLGLEFLRHVERTRALLYLVDITDPDPAAKLADLSRELHHYGKRLPDLPFAVAVTKCDLVDDLTKERVCATVTAWAEAAGAMQTVVVSSVANIGLKTLKNLMRRLYRQSLPPDGLFDAGDTSPPVAGTKPADAALPAEPGGTPLSESLPEDPDSPGK